MKKILSLLLTILVSILIFGCSENSSTSPENNQDVLLPLKVENSWKFSDGREIKVFAKTTLNGVNAFEVKGYESDGSIYYEGYTTNLADGLYSGEDDNLICPRISVHKEKPVY